VNSNQRYLTRRQKLASNNGHTDTRGVFKYGQKTTTK
jgi:hypothetical protein